jgi:hypothetical protein
MARALLRSVLFLLISLLTHPLAAGQLRGRITDSNGEPLSFTSVVRKGTTNGTTANEEGYYQLQLPTGEHEIVFQYVGYRSRTERVTITAEPVTLNIRLEAEVLTLREVEIRPGGEDPAYGIIKAAIKLRKRHLQEVAAAKFQAYMKVLHRLHEVPNRVMGVKVNNLKPGIVYLSETVSEVQFRQPDKFKERVISSKVSGKSQGLSWNMVTDLDVNFYRNILLAGPLSERGFISPLAANALLFYRYEFIGTTEEQGLMINKIKVTPIRKNDPCFSGHLYIIEGSWRLFSVELMLTKNAQIEFADTVRINQQFAQAAGGRVWVLLSQKLRYRAQGFGFKGSGYATAVYSRYQVQPAFPPEVPAATAEPVKLDKDVQTPDVLPKKPARKKARVKSAAPALPPDSVLVLDKLKPHEALVISEEAGKRDSSYWEDVRPVPLTEEEVKDYEVKDSLEVMKESKPYQDSVDRVQNKLNFTDLTLRGYTYRNSYRKQSFSAAPLTRLWQYNTVEGLVANLQLSFRKRYENRKQWEISPVLRYGFSSERFYAKIGGGYTYQPEKLARISAEGGQFVVQFNETEPISPFVNSLYTLLLNRNYLKLYEKSFVRVFHTSEISNGLYLTAGAEYAQRTALQNHISSPLLDWSERSYTPNAPEMAEAADTEFDRNNAILLQAGVRIRFSQEYISRPNQKIILGSKYPQLLLNYRGALSVFQTDARFDEIRIGAQDELELGLFGSIRYQASAGTFTNRSRAFPMDLHHFSGNRTIFARPTFDSFQLLDYYRYSTQHNYLEGHYEHSFNGFFLNKLPLIRKLGWQEVGSLHYLNTKAAGHYIELGAGIEHILKIGRIDFYTSFQQGSRSRTGIRIGFGF